MMRPFFANLRVFRSYGIFGAGERHCFGSGDTGFRGMAMDVNLIFKIAGIGILISVLNMVLKQAGKEEQAQMLTLAGMVVVLFMVIRLIQQLFVDVRSVFGL